MDIQKWENLAQKLLNEIITFNSDNYHGIAVDIIPVKNYWGGSTTIDSGYTIKITFLMKNPFGYEKDVVGGKIDSADTRFKIKTYLKDFFAPLDKPSTLSFATTTLDLYNNEYKLYYDEEKNKISESVIKLLKNFNREFLTEASKIKILTDKFGFDETQSNLLDELCGPLSVWMANKFIDYQKRIFASWEKEVPIDKLTVEKLNENQLIIRKRQMIQSIMDWIRVGLNGNLGNNRNLSLEELSEKSKEWHDSLGVGQGEINYIENNPILIDFRDKDGEGFYWVNLQTNASDEECKRMGHCGRTGYGNNLYSLRETKKIPGGKYILNKSHLTASIGNGTIFQLKGQKNSKPQQKYYQYILPLFDISDDVGNFLIDSIGSEYDSSRDFSIKDLDPETIHTLYEKRPELFKSRKLQKLLIKLNLIDNPKPLSKIIIKIEPKQLSSVIDGDYAIRTRTYKTTTGQKRTETVYIFESILSGDGLDLWDNWDGDWESAVKYNLDEKNELKIKEYLKEIAKNKIEDIDELFETSSIEELIEELDEDGDIKRAIRNAINLVEASDYTEYLYNTLKTACDELGRVIKLDYDGLEVEIDIENLLDDLDDENYEELMYRCDDNLECTWFEYLDITGDKPIFRIDERYYPDIDDKYFNELLEENLNEI